jgi:hypothetical protein
MPALGQVLQAVFEVGAVIGELEDAHYYRL